jgi:hypothetical protein
MRHVWKGTQTTATEHALLYLNNGMIMSVVLHLLEVRCEVLWSSEGHRLIRTWFNLVQTAGF